MLNRIMLIGNLGRDPELRSTPSGTAVAHFSLAVSRYFKDQSGERVKETQWFHVVAWDRLAAICAQYLRTGSKVYVQGRMTSRTYTDSTGVSRTRWDVTASDMQLLDRKPLPTPQPSEPVAEPVSPAAA